MQRQPDDPGVRPTLDGFHLSLGDRLYLALLFAAFGGVVGVMIDAFIGGLG